MGNVFDEKRKVKESKDRGFIAINQKKKERKRQDWMRGENGVHERQTPPKNHKKDQVLETFQLTVLLLLLGSNLLAPSVFPAATALY